jgi:hypothetical protein
MCTTSLKYYAKVFSTVLILNTTHCTKFYYEIKYIVADIN